MKATRVRLAGRNPFHPDYPGRGIAALLEVSHRPDDWYFAAGEMATYIAAPEGLDLNDWRAALPELAVELEADRQRVRNSDDFCCSSDSSGACIQHRLSGLRAEFLPSASWEGFLKVMSRPDGEPDVCKSRDYDDRGVEWWWRYCGLGIGKRVYLQAWEHSGKGRVREMKVTEAAWHLRASLHRNAPYSWEWSGCALEPCASGGWRDASPSGMHS